MTRYFQRVCGTLKVVITAASIVLNAKLASLKQVRRYLSCLYSVFHVSSKLLTGHTLSYHSHITTFDVNTRPAAPLWSTLLYLHVSPTQSQRHQVALAAPNPLYPPFSAIICSLGWQLLPFIPSIAPPLGFKWHALSEDCSNDIITPAQPPSYSVICYLSPSVLIYFKPTPRAFHLSVGWVKVEFWYHNLILFT